jgi:hypothetical protein
MVSTILPAVIVTETNAERSEDALPPLTRSTTLDEAATLKAEHMASEAYFAHYAPDGTSPWHWFDEVSYSYVHAGENLAVHFTDSTEVVEAWMNSPTHRDNIMNGSYHEIGIGTARGTLDGWPTVFVVQLFGTPAAAADPVEDPALTRQTAAATPLPADAEVLGETTFVAAPRTDDLILPVAPTPADRAVLADAGTYETVNSAALEVPPAVTLSEPVRESFASISVAGTPAPRSLAVVAAETTAPVLAVVTKPQLVLQVLYIVFGFLVAVALTLSVIIEIRRQRPVQIMYGVGLLSLMYLLFHVHLQLSSGVLIAAI